MHDYKIDLEGELSSAEDMCSETSDHMEYIEISDDSEFENELPTYMFKDNKIQWYSDPITTSGRTAIHNIMKLVPGITKYAVTQISDDMTTFQLFITKCIEDIIIMIT